MEIINTTALITINETLIVQVVSFLIFLFIIKRLMFRPLRKTMDARGSYLEDIQQDIAAAEKKLVEQTKLMEQRRTTIQNEAFTTSQNMEIEGRQKAVGIIRSAEQEIAAFREKTLQEIQVQVAAARSHAEVESEKLAVGIMEKILDRRLAG